MNAVAKVVIPNKSWIVEDEGIKLGTLNKEKKGFSFYRRGEKVDLKDSKEVEMRFGVALFEESISKVQKSTVKKTVDLNVYDYPTASKPHNPVYNIVKKLPIYAKSGKSKSLYCAGYYVIQFRKGWVKSFCPKLITLERYPYQGPFKTETEMRSVLNIVSKNETTKHITN
jgi:hypothetical protein